MRALLLTAPGRLEMADLPRPEPGSGDVRIRVASCGICGSDVHGYTGSTGRRIPPLVMGHEAAGTVEAVGEGVADLAVGTRVALDSTVFCGACEQCLSGHENLCRGREVLGVSCGSYRRNGCFAEEVVVPRRSVHAIPDALGFVQAALLEPLTIALHAVRLGAAVDLDAGRLAEARRMGAHDTFDASLPAVGRTLADWGRSSDDTDGADLAIEAVGTTAAVATAIEAVTRGGTVVLVGNVSPTIELPLQSVVTRQIRLQGSCASAGCYPEAIRLAADGNVDLGAFVSAVAPLAEGPGWFDRLHRREPGLVKVVLEP
jgi:L-iditol 2-dehydrogenase